MQLGCFEGPSGTTVKAALTATGDPRGVWGSVAACPTGSYICGYAQTVDTCVRRYMLSPWCYPWGDAHNRDYWGLGRVAFMCCTPQIIPQVNPPT